MKFEKFIIEFVKTELGCICYDFEISLAELVHLCRKTEIVDFDIDAIHPAERYDFSPHALKEIKRLHDGIPPYDDLTAHLRVHRKLDDLPYKTHTNRELFLMLYDDKPLAAFSENIPTTSDFVIIPEKFFLPYVLKNEILSIEFITTNNEEKIRHVLYATPLETWRMPAYLLLKETAQNTQWSEDFERLEGSLLGYKNWQIDYYIKNIFYNPYE
jgi:hypothetical protein